MVDRSLLFAMFLSLLNIIAFDVAVSLHIIVVRTLVWGVFPGYKVRACLVRSCQWGPRPPAPSQARKWEISQKCIPATTRFMVSQGLLSLIICVI